MDKGINNEKFEPIRRGQVNAQKTLLNKGIGMD